jgi:hypothetical protein
MVTKRRGKLQNVRIKKDTFILQLAPACINKPAVILSISNPTDNKQFLKLINIKYHDHSLASINPHITSDR